MDFGSGKKKPRHLGSWFPLYSSSILKEVFKHRQSLNTTLKNEMIIWYTDQSCERDGVPINGKHLFPLNGKRLEMNKYNHLHVITHSNILNHLQISITKWVSMKLNELFFCISLYR